MSFSHTWGRACLARLELFRLHHWCKNLLIFFPIFFDGQLLHADAFGAAAWTFLAFSLTASGIYCRNDVQDVASDRCHSTKCRRPIASGRVSVAEGRFWATILPLAGLALTALTAQRPLAAVLILGGYWLMNICYSAGLKNLALVDIAILSAGFLLRLYAGAIACGIAISHWLYLTVLAASLALALGKRLKELMRERAGTRSVLERYSADFLSQYMTITWTLTLVFYSLWALSDDTARHLGTDKMIWSVPLVFFILMRYGLKINGGADGDPVSVLLGDLPLLLMVAGLFALTFVLIYL